MRININRYSIGGRTPRRIGLEIHPTAVRLLALECHQSRWVVGCYASVALPPGAVQEQGLIAQKTIAQAIREVRQMAQLEEREVVVAIPHALLTTHRLCRPSIRCSSLRSWGQAAMAPYLPYPAREAYYDFQLLEGGKILQGVAAPKTLIDTWVEGVTLGGLQVRIMESDAYAQVRACAWALKDPPLTWACVVLEETRVKVYVLHQQAELTCQEHPVLEQKVSHWLTAIEKGLPQRDLQAIYFLGAPPVTERVLPFFKIRDLVVKAVDPFLEMQRSAEWCPENTSAFLTCCGLALREQHYAFEV